MRKSKERRALVVGGGCLPTELSSVGAFICDCTAPRWARSEVTIQGEQPGRGAPWRLPLSEVMRTPPFVRLAVHDTRRQSDSVT